MGIDNPYSAILQELSWGLWEHDVRVEQSIALPYNYSNEDFRACLKIFMSALMKKAFDFGTDEGTAEKIGNELRIFVLTYTGIDTKKLY